MQAIPERPPCRHCGKPAGRPKRLCWKCAATPAIREGYAPVSKFGGRGIGHGCGGYALPEPTRHPPGTPEKVEVLCRRAAAGQSLWHPDDVADPTLSRPPRHGPSGPRVYAVRLPEPEAA